MTYEKELEFFRSILNNYRIHSYIIPANDKTYRKADRGLRDFLGMEEEYDQLFCTPHGSITENMICKITDVFFCNYYFILLPDTKVPTTFIAGPFIDVDLNQNSLLEIAEGMKDSVPCTGCRYCCDGCPMGLDIPGFIHTYNELRTAPSMNAGMRIEFMPEEERPSACIGCGACTAICPQNIDIPGALADLSKRLSERVSWTEICRQREEASKKK